MKVTRRSRLEVRLQNWLFVVLFVGVIAMLAWLTTRHSFDADWTAGQRNTLTEASRQLVASIDAPITVTAFVRDTDAQRRPIEDLVARYQRHHDGFTLEFVNPDVDPDRARRAGITADGEVLVSVAGREERVAALNERSLTTALQRLARVDERWIVFVEGHGERNPHGQANHDYGVFGAEMQRQGLRVRTLNPAAQRTIPDNTSLLVVTTPQAALVPGVAELLARYVAGGGNLLWLGDPGPSYGLEPLADELGVSFADGVVQDATAQLFGIGDPRMVIVAEYAAHPVTRDFQVVTLFPHATAVDHHAVGDDWTVRPLLTTLATARLDERDGPLDIGITLTRPRDDGPEQRVAVLGDGDFLSNAYLGNAGNLELGLNLVNWLVADDAQINVLVRSAPDLVLNLSRTAFITIAVGSLVGLPLLLIAAGVTIWIRRRRR